MEKRSFGWLIAIGFALGPWSAAHAQVAISTPYPGPGVSINTPFFSYSSGYNALYPGYPYTSFGATYLAPGLAVPNAGYYGTSVPYAYPGLGYSPYGYAPYYGYSSYYGYYARPGLLGRLLGRWFW